MFSCATAPIQIAPKGTLARATTQYKSSSRFPARQCPRRGGPKAYIASLIVSRDVLASNDQPCGVFLMTHFTPLLLNTIAMFFSGSNDSEKIKLLYINLSSYLVIFLKSPSVSITKPFSYKTASVSFIVL